MKAFFLLGAIIGAAIYLMVPQSLAAADQPVVVELFTSQSCSSCPPADENLEDLTKDPNVIALGFHVTYWNHLHWEDTLSHEFASTRQRKYGDYNGTRRVYTPQMIVNGEEEFVGSRTALIANALAGAKPIASITFNRDEGGVMANLPTIKNGDYTLWLAGIKNKHVQEIPSGENRGRTVTYANAVTSFEKLGHWDGAQESKALEFKPSSHADHYVLLAQQGGHGAITAAGKLIP